MNMLPKLPGLQLPQHLQKTHHPKSHYFNFINGYSFVTNPKPVNEIPAINLNYEPRLIYDVSNKIHIEPFIPDYVIFDQKVLTFYGFFSEKIDPRNNFFNDHEQRYRYVNIYYHLEDDTMSAVEPRILNSGLVQGKFLRRSKVHKSKDNHRKFWHWKDFHLGLTITLNGIPIKIINCDKFTRNFLESQGVDVRCPEKAPNDLNIQRRLNKESDTPIQTKKKFDDKFLRLLKYNDQMLCFKVLWDNEQNQQRRLFYLYYHLAENTITLKDLNPLPIGLNASSSFPVFLKRQRLPKNRNPNLKINFPSHDQEMLDDDIIEYYELKDFLVGNTIDVFGRSLLIYDCNEFTRRFFHKKFNIEQKPKLEDVQESEPVRETIRQLPTPNAYGALNDSMLNCLSINVEKSHENYIRKLFNSNKILRYGLEMTEELSDRSNLKTRQFILLYRLSDGYIQINEILNNGRTFQKYLKYCLIQKPNSDIMNPDYYNPNDFAIGAILDIYGRQFKIISADLYVFKYMEANQSKFEPNVFESVQNFMKNSHLIS